MSERATGLGGTGRIAPRGRRRVWEVSAAVALLGVLTGVGGVMYSLRDRQIRLGRELEYALSNGDAEATGRLLRQGAGLPKSPSVAIQFTALAATQRTTDLLREVLDRGAPVNAVPPNTLHPILLGAQAGRSENIQLLLERGAGPDTADRDGKTALMYATAASGTPDVLRTLLKAGADINLADQQGQTAMMWAIRWNDPVYVELLRDAGADLNVRDNSGLTALESARLSEQAALRRAARDPRTRGALARTQRIVAALSDTKGNQAVAKAQRRKEEGTGGP